MMRLVPLTMVVAALALTPALAPSHDDASGASLVASGARAAAPWPSIPDSVAACAPVVDARVVDAAQGIVALRWEPCESVEAYRVLRAPGAGKGTGDGAGDGAVDGTFREIVQVRHAGHLDTGLTPGMTYRYAVVQNGSDLPATLQGVAVTIE